MNKKDLTVRKTDKEDIVKELHAKIFPLDTFYEHKNSFYWLAYHKETPVGFAQLTILNKEIAYLSRAGLLPEVRGKGLHKRLVKVREIFARKKGIERLITYTLNTNMYSAVTLSKHGYMLYVPENEYAGKTGKETLYFIKYL